jgi:hypothetical protein
LKAKIEDLEGEIIQSKLTFMEENGFIKEELMHAESVCIEAKMEYA